MSGTDSRTVGTTNLKLSPLGFGAAPIGNTPAPLSDDQCHATVIAAYEAGVRYFDTSPAYGNGLSEHLLGRGLRSIESRDFVLSTKVGRYLVPKPDAEVQPSERSLRMKSVLDYSFDAAMRSVDQSFQRLGLNKIDMLMIHDVDIKTHRSEQAYEQRFREAMNGAYLALEKLRSEGTITAIGIGVHDVEPCIRFLNAGDFDAIMLSGHYTLLEQSALETVLPLCVKKSTSLLVAGPFASGVLATGSVPGSTFKYNPASREVLAKVAHIEKICQEFGVALPAAALQFAFAHPAIASVVTGAISPDQAYANATHFRAKIPSAFWSVLKDEGILSAEAPVPQVLESSRN